jgi:hypothetical protein
MPFEKICGISHYRTVYASPLKRLGLRNGSGLRYAQTFGLNIPTPLLRHILPALVADLRSDASQSPYPGRQTVANSRNVMRNFS